jgi:hypothetical protein
MRAARVIATSVILTVLLSTAGVSGQKEEKNEPDLLIKAARFLEQQPFDKSAKDVRGWAIKWVIDTDKVSVTVCSLMVSGIDKKYKYSGEVFGQYTIGMAAFKLANPDRAKDEDAAQLAGIESTLTSYEAMVKAQPKAKNAFLDGLLAKRADGSMAKYVAENNCKDKVSWHKFASASSAAAAFIKCRS